MTVTAYGGGGATLRRADETFRNLKGSLADLQAQLATGRKADGYAGLGAGAATSLATRSRLAGYEAQLSGIQDGRLRLAVMSQGLTALEKLASGLRTSLPGSYNQTLVGQTSAQVSAEDGLRQAIGILNTEVAGRHLFSGRAADTAPVLDVDLLLDGTAGRAGLRQLIAERKAADRGPDGMGRLALTGAGTSVTLSEEAAGLPFGFKLSAAGATGTGITVGLAAGPPAAAMLTVVAQPAVGDSVSVTLTGPDGTPATLTLTVGAAGSAVSAKGFPAGATTAETAANLQAALAAAVLEAGATKLASSSALQASRTFFSDAGGPPPRVAGPPFSTATALVPGAAADTVVWYAGDTGAGSPRETSVVRTGDQMSVAIGARADEAPFRALLANLAALAAEDFPTTDAASQGRYAALAESIAGDPATDGLQRIAADLSLANVAFGHATDRIEATRNQLQDVLGDVENADPNEVAAKLLQTQTRLQASYQTTASIARLSLVDYL